MLLFNPRTDRWKDHFDAAVVVANLSIIELKGLTPTGRATVHLLGMNDQIRRTLRFELWKEGLYIDPELGGS